jgi:hypothetical protein
MKAIIFDPYTYSLEVKELKDNEEMYKALSEEGYEVRVFDIAGFDNFSIFFDDEGLLRDKFFYTTMQINEYEVKLAGKLIFTGPGDEEGETLDIQLTKQQVFDLIKKVQYCETR